MVIYVIQRAYNWQYSWELYTDIDNVPCGEKKLEFGSGHVSPITRYGEPAKPVPLDEGVHLATRGLLTEAQGQEGSKVDLTGTGVGLSLALCKCRISESHGKYKMPARHLT